MATINIGGVEHSILEAVVLLTNEVAELQVTNADLTTRLERTQERLDDFRACSRPTLAVINSVPPFHGKLDENIIYFFHKFEQVANFGSLTDSQRLNGVKSRLEDAALEHSMTNVTCKSAATYLQFKEAMIFRYKTKNTARYYRGQLSSLTQKENESIEEFSSRIESINVHTYEITDSPEHDATVREEADQRALDTFLNGLTSSLADRVRITLPKTFPEAQANAINIREALRHSHTRANVDDTTEASVFVTNTLYCTRCNRTSHTAQQCFARYPARTPNQRNPFPLPPNSNNYRPNYRNSFRRFDNSNSNNVRFQPSWNSRPSRAPNNQNFNSRNRQFDASQRSRRFNNRRVGAATNRSQSLPPSRHNQEQQSQQLYRQSTDQHNTQGNFRGARRDASQPSSSRPNTSQSM